MSDELIDPRKQFPVKMQCPKCQQTGTAIWEETRLPNPRGLQPILLSLPGGFYLRVKNTVLEGTEVVCNKCGTVQPE